MTDNGVRVKDDSCEGLSSTRVTRVALADRPHGAYCSVVFLGTEMRLRILCCALAVQPLCSVQSQTPPLVDHHQHLFSPATAALISPKPLPPIDLPPDLGALLQARSRDARNASELRGPYTDEAALLHFSHPGWIRGRDSVVAWWIRCSCPPNPAPREAWAAFRQLPLSDAAFRTIASNVAPYMR